MRTVVAQAIMGVLDQGTIFTAGAATNYLGCHVYGLLITARCDLEHEKTHVFHYIPVVELIDWMRRDFVWVACKRLRNDQQGALRAALAQAGYSPAILLTKTPQDVLEALFPEEAWATKAEKKQRGRVELSVRRLELLDALSAKEPERLRLGPLFVDFEKPCRTILGELAHQVLSGYYFLRSVEPEQSRDTGFVALLREIRHLPTVAARHLSEGLTRDGFDQLCATDPQCAGSLDMTISDFAMPIGCVRSPEIEHLIQVFTHQFARIGVKDPDGEYVGAFSDHLLSCKELK